MEMATRGDLLWERLRSNTVNVKLATGALLGSLALPY